jgi:hypothetical protein
MFAPHKNKMAKRSSQSQFRIKCSVCGEYGTVRIKREDKNKKKKQRKTPHMLKQLKEDIDSITKHDYHMAVLKCFFDFNTLLNDLDSKGNKKKPIIIVDPTKKLESEPRDRNKASDDVLRDLAKSISLFLKMLPLVTLRYPEDIIAVYSHWKKFDQYITPVFKLLETLLSAIPPTIIYHQENLLTKWALTVKKAVQKREEKNPRAAAEIKKYSGITFDGKRKGHGEEKVPISIPVIREKMPEIQEFFRNYNSSKSISIAFISVVMKKICEDAELMADYRMYEKDYDYNEKLQQQLQQKNRSDEKEKSYYEYFLIKHYDPKLYEVQKYRLNIRCDGRREHRIKEKDIAPEIVQVLRSRRSS